MVITLYREALESSLIKRSVTHNTMRNAPSHCMRVREPPKKVRHLNVLLRPDDDVPMIGQDAIRQDADCLPLMCLDHDALKRLKVILLSEHVHLPGRSVVDVINKPARCYSRCSGHNSE